MKKQWAAEINPPPTAFYLSSSAFFVARLLPTFAKPCVTISAGPDLGLCAAPLRSSTENVNHKLSRSSF
jgi:hypothetical protein